MHLLLSPGLLSLIAASVLVLELGQHFIREIHVYFDVKEGISSTRLQSCQIIQLLEGVKRNAVGLGEVGWEDRGLVSGVVVVRVVIA